MKTAISIPDEIFGAADELAHELGMSRSELYSRAVRDYIGRQRDEDVTQRLNEVYAQVDARLDPALEELQYASLTEDEM